MHAMYGHNHTCSLTSMNSHSPCMLSFILTYFHFLQYLYRDPAINWKKIAMDRYKREIMMSPNLISLLAPFLAPKMKKAVTAEDKYQYGVHLHTAHYVCSPSFLFSFSFLYPFLSSACLFFQFSIPVSNFLSTYWVLAFPSHGKQENSKPRAR